MPRQRRFVVSSLLLGFVLTALRLAAPAAGGGGVGDISLDAEFTDMYEAFDLGVPPVPSPFGGITASPGNPDALLLGGGAVDAGGAVYEIGLLRDCSGHILGFDGTTTLIAEAPFIDGGLRSAPGGVLMHTTYDTNTLAQFLPGSTTADKVIDLSAAGVLPSTGGMTIVPPGLPGEGRLKVTSYDTGAWFDLGIVPDGQGMFDVVAGAAPVGDIGEGPEGIAYLRGGVPHFDTDTVLVAQWDACRVDAFDVDRNGDPVPGSRRTFVNEVIGPEGAMIDPITGDIIVSSLSASDRVYVIRQIEHCPWDVDDDGDVGVLDLLFLLADWAQCTPADVDADGEVGFLDLLHVLSRWGDCPEA